MSFNFKKPLKSFFLFLTFAAFITSCVDEEIFTPTGDGLEEVISIDYDTPVINHVTGQEIPKIVEELSSQLGILEINKQIGKISFNKVNIDLRQIMEVISNGGNTNYTFPLDVIDASENHIYNLVVNKKSNGSISKAYIIAYEMQPEDMKAFLINGDDFRKFKATYRYYNFKTFFEESKHGRVGKSGDCGSGSIGGGNTGQSLPGSTFVHTYNGTTVNSTFGNNTHGSSYTYTSNISSDGNVSSQTTTATSTTISMGITTTGNTAIQAPALTTGVPTVSVTTTTQQAGGGGEAPPCLGTIVVQEAPDGGGGTIDMDVCDPKTQKNKSLRGMKAGDCPNGDGVVGISTAAKSVQKLYYYLDDSLSAGEIGWFKDSEYPERTAIAHDIVWFILDNGRSNEAKGFAILGIDVLLNGGQVSFDDHVHLENEINNPCISAILNKLQNKDMQRLTIPDIGGLDGTGHLAQGILNLFDKSGEYDITFKVAEAGSDSNGNPRNATTQSIGDGWGVTLDDDYVNKATKLSIARTIIHESVHAYIGYILKENRKSDTVSNLQTIYQKYSAEDNAFNLTQHEFMSQFVEGLARSLSVWDYGRQSVDYYQQLSWAGLESSPTYKNLPNKNEIQNTIRNEATGSSGARGEECN